jgi:hypothetical protein
MTQFLRSYFFAYVVVLGIALGCLGLLLLHSLVGGEWGKVSRGILQAGADTLPWLAVLFVPILLGFRRLYPGINRVSLPFFILRALIYFGVWSWTAYRQRSFKGSGVGLLLFVLTVSFSSFDWVMSLEPKWASSIYGAMLMTGDILGALAFTVMMLSRQSSIAEGTALDLGNLLLTFVMLWAYMALSQYLIIWSANLPEEIGWYLARQRGGWQYVAIILILFQFALPFAFLLSRQLKRKLASLAAVAGGVLMMRVIDIFWLTVPDFSPGRFSFHFLDGVMLLALTGFWMFLFRTRFEKETSG